MKKKLGLLFLVAVVAIASVGMSYSLANGGLTLLGVPNCYCDVAFVEPVTARDNEVEKFIGVVTAELVDVDDDGLYDKVWVEIDHAYPGYVVYIDFTVENKGNRPINVNGLIPISYDAAAMSFGLDGDITEMSFPWWLNVGCSVDGTLVITVENGALQNHVYEFTVGLGFYNEECPQYTHVETVIVDADNPDPTLSTADLEDGVDYTLVATGTADAGDTIDFDAKYSITNRIPGDDWTDVVSGYGGYGSTLLDLFVNGAPGGWGVFNADHKYECTITGNGNPVELLIYDICYPNNVGSLTVDIYKIS